MICIKDVCVFIDVAQSKNQSVQMTGTVAFVKVYGKILIKYSTETVTKLNQSRQRHQGCGVEPYRVVALAL
ncbi:hypothetical protein DM684_13295 [Salmonella bongori]|nr:hypothetical protein [Salmonella bongori]ECI3519026.1 hypothetical protein [Salmonella bongori]